MGLNTLDIKMFDTPKQAPIYREPEYEAAILNSAVVVGNGTEKGNATVDLIFVDKKGQKHIAMITGGLMRMLNDTIVGMEQRTVDLNSPKGGVH